MEQASHLVTESQLSVLKFGLALHTYSPKVEMFAQMAKERDLLPCAVVADVDGDMSCNVKGTKALIHEVRIRFDTISLPIFRKRVFSFHKFILCAL